MVKDICFGLICFIIGFSVCAALAYYTAIARLTPEDVTQSYVTCAKKYPGRPFVIEHINKWAYQNKVLPHCNPVKKGSDL